MSWTPRENRLARVEELLERKAAQEAPPDYPMLRDILRYELLADAYLLADLGTLPTQEKLRGHVEAWRALPEALRVGLFVEANPDRPMSAARREALARIKALVLAALAAG